MEKINDIVDDDPLMEILGRALKARPAKIESVRGFLKEFWSVGQEALLDFSLAEFKPFWGSILDTTRAAMRAERPAARKWRLRSRIAMRPQGEEEMQARIRLHAGCSLDLATSIRTPSGELLEEESHQARLVQVAIEFSTALRDCPDILLKAAPSEIQALEKAAKHFANIN